MRGRWAYRIFLLLLNFGTHPPARQPALLKVAVADRNRTHYDRATQTS